MKTLLFIAICHWGTSLYAQTQTPESVLDFRPYDEGLLVLSKKGETVALSLHKEEDTIHFELGTIKPRRIFVDCMGLTHLIAGDSCYQVSLVDDSTYGYSVMSRSEFNHYIIPCVAAFEERVVLEDFNRSTGNYVLTAYQNQEATVLYTNAGTQKGGKKMVSSTGRNEMPASDFNEAISSQNRTMSNENFRAYRTFGISSADEMNPMTWSIAGRSDSGAEQNSATFNEPRRRRFYSETSPTLDILTEQLGNFMVVLDDNTDSVTVLDHQGYRIISNPLEQRGDDLRLFKDHSDNKLYVGMKEADRYLYYEMDPFKGTMELVLDTTYSSAKTNAFIHQHQLYTIETEGEVSVIKQQAF